MNDKTEHVCRILLILCLLALVVWITMEYLLPIAVPFFVAYLISLAVRPFSRFVRSRCRALDKVLTVCFLVVVILVPIWGAHMLVDVTLDQLSNLVTSFVGSLSRPDSALSEALRFIADIGERLPFLKKLGIDTLGADEAARMIAGLAEGALVRITSSAASLATSMIGALPSFVVSLFVTISATFYFSLDRGELSSSVAALISPETAGRIERCRTAALSALVGYLKTYLLMMLVVFTMLYLGLTVIGVGYSFVVAMLIALVDLLPILGVGTVLIPWSLVEFIGGDTFRAAALIVLFVVITVVRELLEPRVIGGYIGVHPILALASVYGGMRLFGLWGLILAPIVLGVTLSVVRASTDTRRASAGED